MKYSILIAYLIISSPLVKAQYTFNDIFKTNKVYFYGYDFTNFKLVESKRIGEDEKIKLFIFEEIQWLNEKRTEKKYASWLMKDTVTFMQDVVNELNSQIKADQIIPKSQAAFQRHSIPKDSLQNMINRYDTKGLSGIGFVQIVECFYKVKKEASVWYVFFDLATKRILDAHENFNTDADSYHGLAEYWGVGMSISMDQYHVYYKKMMKNAVGK